MINPIFFLFGQSKNNSGFKCNLVECFNPQDWIGFVIDIALYFLQWMHVYMFMCSHPILGMADN